MQIGGADFNSADFPSYTHIGNKIETTEILGEILKEMDIWAGVEKISEQRTFPDKEQQIYAIVQIKVSKSKYAKDVPFALVLAPQKPDLGELTVIFNPKAGVDTLKILNLYKEEVEKRSSAYIEAINAIAAEKEKEKERKAKQIEIIKNPDFFDMTLSMITVEGSIQEIKETLSKFLEKGKIAHELEDISSSHRYANPDGGDFFGLLLASTFNIIAGEHVPSVLVIGADRDSAGAYDIVFSPDFQNKIALTNFFAANFEKNAIRSKSIRADVSGLRDNPEAGISQSSDKVDFTAENFQFREVEGNVSEIFKASLEALKTTIPYENGQRYRFVISTIPASRVSRLPENPSTSIDGDNFYEGFRILFFDKNKYQQGVSVLALFGEPESHLGSFDLIFNPEFELDIEKFMEKFNAAMEKFSLGDNSINRTKQINELLLNFENHELERNSFESNLYDLCASVSNFYYEKNKNAPLRFLEYNNALSSSKSKNIISNRLVENVNRMFIYLNEGASIKPIALIKGHAGAKNGVFVVILSKDAEEYADALFKRIQQFLKFRKSAF